MKHAYLLAAGILALPLMMAAPAVAQTTTSCESQLRHVEQHAPQISDQEKRDAVTKIWQEADQALKSGDEQACQTKIQEAMDHDEIPAMEG